MARKRSRKDRWELSLQRIGFCYNRGGIVYTDIQYKGARIRQATTLTWHNNNKQESLKILEKRIDTFLNPPKIQYNEKYTLYRLIEKFRSSHVIDLSVTARQKFEQALQHFLKKDFYLEDVEQIQDHILENKKSCTLNPNTARKLLQNLSQMFNTAVDAGNMPRNPITKLMLPRPIPTNQVAFTDSEVQQIIHYFKEQPDKEEFVLLLKFISLVGLRINEAINIKWSDIDNDMIKINGKGGKTREFPLLAFPEVSELLDKIKRFSNNGKLFHWNSYSKLEKWVRDAREALGIEKQANFHAIRKMRENQMIHDEDVDSNDTAEIIGHSRRVQDRHYLETLGGKKLGERIIRRRKR